VQKSTLSLLVLALMTTPIMASWAQVPLPILVDQADLIVIGKVIKVQDGGFGTLGPGKADHIVKHDVAVIEVSAVLKGSPLLGKAKEVQLGQPAKGFINSATVLFSPGQQGIWLLTKDPGPNPIVTLKDGILVPDPDRKVFWARHPSQFQDAKKQKEIADLIVAREKVDAGKAVKGLVARAEVIEGPEAVQVRFSLKNVSEKPITVCNYVGNQPLKVKWTGPNGKVLLSKHYDWLRAADIPGIAKSNFVAIQPGGALLIGPRGPGSTFMFHPSTMKAINFANVAPAGKNTVTISYTNNDDGKKFGLENVWTGTVTANEVSFTSK
jgi:hypothetical protein